MKNKIKILTIIGIIAVVVLGIIVYAATTTETETGTIIYYAEDGVTEIARQDVTQGSEFTILDDAVATEGRWISNDKGLTFAIGQKLAWNSGLFPLVLKPYKDDFTYELPEEIIETPTYIPAGYTPVDGTELETGYTIQDSLGNQYVWVEVPQTLYDNASYNTETTTGDRKPSSATDYDNIEYCLHQYTSVYRNGTPFTDTYYSDETTGLTETEYYELKNKMLKSVYQNGGFYVGKYEAGTETARTYSSDTLTTPVIQQNVYPYNNITTAQAQSLASGMASGDYTSSLMFGVQWDLVLKYLETKGATQAELNEDSTSWGNYRDNLWNVVNINSRYYSTSEGWSDHNYGYKTSESNVLLTTGADNSFSKQGIYDLAGNVYEETLEYSSSSDYPCVIRGGGYDNDGSSNPARLRYIGATWFALGSDGFRVSLYYTPEEPAYIPDGFTHVADTTMDDGYTIEDSSGNQYVWVEVPQTEEVYPTAGLAITEFTDAEYTSIEEDLHTYTSVYRNGTSFTDTYYSDETTGLTETEYYELKNKMLKSVYQNGGFYVGKYEAGTETARTSSSDTLTTPVIKQNMYPYNYVTTAQAQSLASGMESGDYTSSLMFGVQWDLVLKYLETKGAARVELQTDSTSWGNYYNNLWNVVNINSRYYTSDAGWSDHNYGYKTSESNVLLTTGADNSFSKQGIYDLAGNVWERTLEKTSDSDHPCAVRGGVCALYGSDFPASYRSDVTTSFAYHSNGFRVSLY